MKVDIGTEWNLKVLRECPPASAHGSRYRNRVEFKDCSIGVKRFPVARRYRSKAKLRVNGYSLQELPGKRTRNLENRVFWLDKRIKKLI